MINELEKHEILHELAAALKDSRPVPIGHAKKIARIISGEGAEIYVQDIFDANGINSVDKASRIVLFLVTLLAAKVAV